MEPARSLPQQTPRFDGSYGTDHERCDRQRTNDDDGHVAGNQDTGPSRDASGHAQFQGRRAGYADRPSANGTIRALSGGAEFVVCGIRGCARRSATRQEDWTLDLVRLPQIDGLGASEFSQTFALDGEEEAAEFLRDPELRARLLTISRAVVEQLRTGRAKSLRTLMGSDIDAKKVVSSLTLLGHVAKNLHKADGIDAYSALATVADEVLALAAAEGYPPCAYTLRPVRG